MMDSVRAPSPLLYIIPAVICLFAVVQRTLVETQDLNPWKGGGFGMFAAMPPYRGTLVKPVALNNQQYLTPASRRLRPRVTELEMHPTESRISAYARHLLAEEWVLLKIGGAKGDYPVVKTDAPANRESEPIEIKRVDIDIVEYVYDPATLRMVRHPVAEVITRK